MGQTPSGSSPIEGIVNIAMTLVSAIAQRNRQVVDGLVSEKTQIKQLQDQAYIELTDLRNIRDGLISEKIELMAIQATKRVRGDYLNGMGLFYSRRIKRENIKVDANKRILMNYQSEAEEVAMEIQQLAGEVSELRHLLDIRTDQPLTKLEARIQESGSVDPKWVFIGLGVFSALAIIGYYS